MQTLTKNNGLWLGGSAAVAAIAGLGWFLLPGDTGQVEAGQLVVTQTPEAPLPEASPAPVTAPMAPIPVTPTNANGNKAAKQAESVIYEKRDPDWAKRSEAAIQRFLNALPYIGGQRYLTVKCAASACEVSGVADADPETGSMKPVWESLEHDTGGAELRAAGLERTAIVFDTGRSGDEFKLYYGRVAEPRAP